MFRFSLKYANSAVHKLDHEEDENVMMEIVVTLLE